MQMRRVLPLSLCALLALAMVACEEEGPAYSETAAGEAPIVGTELEEDASLADDIPIGEPGIMDISGHDESAEPGHVMEPVAYDQVPPVSRAVQETPSLPGGESTWDSRDDRGSMAPVADPVGGSGASAEAGAGVYAASCASCHGVRGAGDTTIGRRNEIADLASAKVQNLEDADLAAIIRGDAGTAAEQAHGKISLTDEQVQNLITWIRSL